MEPDYKHAINFSDRDKQQYSFNQPKNDQSTNQNLYQPMNKSQSFKDNTDLKSRPETNRDLLINDLRQNNRQLTEELQIQRERLVKMEQNHPDGFNFRKEIDRINNKLQQKNDEVNALKLRLNQQHEQINQNQTQNLTKELEEKKQEIENLKIKYEQLSKNIGQQIPDYQVQELRIKLKDYETKMPYISQECQKLNALIQQKNSELEAYKVRVSQIDQIQSQIHQEKEVLLKETHRLRQIIEKQAQEYANIAEQRGQVREWESKSEMLVKENEALQVRLKEKIMENEQIKTDFSKFKIQMETRGNMEQKINERDQKIRLLIAEIEKLTLAYDDKENECDQLLSQLKNFENVHPQKNILESKIQEFIMVNADLERKLHLYQKQLKAKDEELMESYQQSGNIEQARQKARELKGILEFQKSDESKQMYESENKFKSVQSNDHKDAELKFKNFEYKIKELAQDLEHWKNLAQKEKERNERIEEKHLEENIQIEKDIKTLHDQNNSYFKEAEQLRQKLNVCNQQIQNFNNQQDQRLRESQLEIQKLQSEIQRTRFSLQERNKEVDQLRVKLGGVEIQDKNALEREFRKMREILESKLQELDQWKDKYQMLENKYNDNQYYEIELRRLKEILEIKLDEVEEWKTKYIKLEDDTKNKLISENEVRKLKDLLEIKMKEVEEWSNKYDRLELLVGEKDQASVKMMEIFEKNNKLILEVERLNRLNAQKTQEIEEWSTRYRQMDSTASDNNNLHREVVRLKGILEDKLLEIDDLKSSVSKYELQIGEQGGSTKLIQDYENKIQKLNNHIDVVERKLTNKNQEIEDIRLKSGKLETVIKDRELLELEIRKLKSILEDKLYEMDQLKDQNRQLELAIADTGHFQHRTREKDAKMEGLQNELERLSKVIREKNIELQESQSQQQILRNEIRDKSLLQNEILRLKEILEDKMTELDDVKRQRSKLEFKLSEYNTVEIRIKDQDDKISMLTNECSRVNNVLKEKMSELEDWRVQCSKLESKTRDQSVMQKEIWQMKSLLEGKMSEIDDWKQRYQQLEYEFSDRSIYEGKIRDYESKMQILNREIERLSNSLKEKISDLDHLRTKHQKLENNIRDRKELEHELLRIKSILQNKLSENDELKANIQRSEIATTEIEGMSNELVNKENKIQQLVIEIEQTSRQLREITINFEDFKQQYAKMETVSQNQAVYENQIRQLKEILENKMNENDELRQKNQSVYQLKDQIQFYENQLLEINYIKQQAEQETKDKLILENELKKMKIIFEDKISEIYQIEQLLDLRTQEMDEWKMKHNNLETRIGRTEGLEEQIRLHNDRIQEYEEFINSLNIKYESLQAQLRQKEQNAQINQQNINDLIKANDDINDLRSQISAYIDRINDLEEELNQRLPLQNSDIQNSPSSMYSRVDRVKKADKVQKPLLRQDSPSENDSQTPPRDNLIASQIHLKEMMAIKEDLAELKGRHKQSQEQNIQLRNLLETKVQEVEEMKIQMEVKEMKQSTDEAFQNIVKQNSTLNQTIEQQKMDISILKQQLVNLQYSDQVNVGNAQQIIDLAHGDINRLQQINDKLRRDYGIQIMENLQLKIQLQIKLDTLLSNFNVQNQALKEINIKCEQLRLDYVQLESQKTKEKQKLNEQIDKMKQELQEYNNLSQNNNENRIILQEKDLEIRLLQNKINSLVSENDILQKNQQKLNVVITDLETLRLKLKETWDQNQKLSDENQKLKINKISSGTQSSQEVFNLQNQIQQLKKQHKKDIEQINVDYQTSIRESAEQQLRPLLKKVDDDKKALLQKIDILQKELQTLQSQHNIALERIRILQSQ